MRRKDWLVVAGIVLSTVLVVACGGSGENGSTISKADLEEAQLEFAQCMREHGVDMPDPEPGQGGIVFRSTSKGGGKGKGLSGGPDDPATRKAMAACNGKLQAAMPEPSPEQEEETKEHALEFAQCMREHGVDMPDPTFSGGGKVQMSIKAPQGGTSGPLMEKAQEACQDKLPMMRFGSKP